MADIYEMRVGLLVRDTFDNLEGEVLSIDEADNVILVKWKNNGRESEVAVEDVEVIE